MVLHWRWLSLPPPLLGSLSRWILLDPGDLRPFFRVLVHLNVGWIATALPPRIGIGQRHRGGHLPLRHLLQHVVVGNDAMVAAGVLGGLNLWSYYEVLPCEADSLVVDGTLPEDGLAILPELHPTAAAFRERIVHARTKLHPSMVGTVRGCHHHRGFCQTPQPSPYLLLLAVHRERPSSSLDTALTAGHRCIL